MADNEIRRIQPDDVDILVGRMDIFNCVMYKYVRLFSRILP